MSSRRDQLRGHYLAGVCTTLAGYILAGHEVHLRTEHGRDAQDNRIIFEIRDWPIFANFLDDPPESRL